MEQMILDQMLMTQLASSSKTTAKPTQEQDRSDSFRKLMERQTTKAESKTETASSPAEETEGVVPDAETSVLPDEQSLENQMALVAAAMLQNPVVPMEQTVAAAEPVQEGAAAVFREIADAAAPASTPETPETSAPLPETEQVPVVEQPEGVEKQVSTEQPMDSQLPEETPKKTDTFQETVQQTVRTETRAESSVQKEKSEVSSEAPVETDVEAPVFREVREIPVKVGETPATEETQETAVSVKDQISTKLAEAVQNGDTKLELQLEPSSLGKVTIEMTWSQDGALHIAMHADSARTQDLLSRNTEGLQSLLSRDVRQEVRVEVPRQEESQRQQFYDGRQGHNSQQERHQQERRPAHPENSENFLHQLRLGLIPIESDI